MFSDRQVTPNESECMYFQNTSLGTGWRACNTILKNWCDSIDIDDIWQNRWQNIVKSRNSSQNFETDFKNIFLTQVVIFKGYHEISIEMLIKILFSEKSSVKKYIFNLEKHHGLRNFELNPVYQTEKMSP